MVPGSLVAVLPVEPSQTGNGVAMRAASVVAAAERDFRVWVAVVPVAGRNPGRAAPGRIGLPLGELVLGDRRITGPGLSTLIADPAWRDRLAAAAPLPVLARDVSPGYVTRLTEMVTVQLPNGGHGVPVHVMRSYLAPLGLALAERLGSPWATLDLDDDDEAFVRGAGDLAEADAYHRLVATFAPQFSRVAIAAPGDAAAVGRRHGLEVAVVPNSVTLPAFPRRDPDPSAVLLFVGTLNFRPNADAALALADEVLPAVRSDGHPEASAWIVGSYSPTNPVAGLASRPDVVLFGYVEDLSELYARAAAVVVPLTQGSGTKFKILEAFAHGVPVVTTPVGAAGLGVQAGVHLLVGRGPEEMAEHLRALLADPELGAGLAAAAREYVLAHHSPPVVERAVGALFAEAAIRP